MSNDLPRAGRGPLVAAAQRPPHPATVVAQPAGMGLPAAAQRPPHAATVPRSTAPHPATVAQLRAHPSAPVERPPHAATVTASPPARAATALVQRMKKRDEEEDSKVPSYPTLLKCPQYTKQPTIIMTLSFDGEEQTTLFNTSYSFYSQQNNCTILNDAPIVYDVSKQEIGIVPNKVKQALDGQDVLLVVTTHGNYQWLFGELPGQEGTATKKAAAQIRGLQKDCNARIRRIVLDACWSATELESPREDVNNHCVARSLSKHLSTGYIVYGFNGKATSGTVNFYDAEHKLKKASYADNVVIFVDGEVTKGSTLDGKTVAIYHSTANMGRSFYRKIVFGGELPEYYRAKSF
jgi:hypothetical protein